MQVLLTLALVLTKTYDCVKFCNSYFFMLLIYRNASLREHHVRQLEDLRRYYEGEITALKKQLVDMKNVIFHQKEQEGSVKGEIQKEFENLTQMNLELSSKCDALESEIQLTQNQLKQTNLRKQELESQCQQLVAANQIIDVKCKELKRTKDEIQTKVTELNDQCDLVNNEKGICKILLFHRKFTHEIKDVFFNFGSL